MPERMIPGRALVSRRAIVEIVRTAVLGSYGVSGFTDDGPLGWLRVLARRSHRGIRVSTSGALAIDLSITVAFGLPVAEVSRQVDSAVRYAIQRTLSREVDRLSIHVGGMRYEPASVPPPVEPAEEAETAAAVEAVDGVAPVEAASAVAEAAGVSG